MGRGLTGAVLAVVLALAATGAADAAGRSVPFGYSGVVYEPPSHASLPVESQFPLMARSGVESIRTPLYWNIVQASPAPPDFSSFDVTVELTARRGIEVLPVVMWSPTWASSRPGATKPEWHAPEPLSLYADFLREAIRRYGPRGSFWAEHPELTAQPIRAWQIWNEPSAPYFWATPDYRKSYPELLQVAYRAVHAADPGAKVVAAGLASFLQSGDSDISTSWADQRAFYATGARRFFDVAAVHVFTRSVENTIRVLRAHRRVMRRAGDARKPLYVTELSFLASRGRIPRSAEIGLEVTPAQQRRLLRGTYRRLPRTRALRVRRAYWFNWSSSYSSRECETGALGFQFVGLVSYRCGGSTYRPMGLLSSYSRAARALQGCAKSADARRCR